MLAASGSEGKQGCVESQPQLQIASLKFWQDPDIYLDYLPPFSKNVGFPHCSLSSCCLGEKCLSPQSSPCQNGVLTQPLLQQNYLSSTFGKFVDSDDFHFMLCNLLVCLWGFIKLSRCNTQGFNDAWMMVDNTYYFHSVTFLDSSSRQGPRKAPTGR